MSAFQGSVAKVSDKPFEIILHIGPDFDAIFATWTLRRFGEEQFPGVEDGKLSFAVNGVGGTDADHKKDRVIPIDVGKGFLSEHRGPDGRLSGKCATTLTMEHLGLSGRPDSSRLVAEANEADNHPGTTRTSLPCLVKLANHFGADPMMTVSLVTSMIDVVIGQELYHRDAVKGEKSLLAWYDALSTKDGSILTKEESVRSRMIRSIKLSMDLGDEKVTELAYVLRCLERSGFEKNETERLLLFLFNLMQKDIMEFQVMMERIRPLRRNMMRVYTDDPTNPKGYINLLVLDGFDGANAHKAAMRNDPGVEGPLAAMIVVRNTTGNVQIQTHNKGMWNTKLDRLYKSLVWHEMDPELRKKINVDQVGNDPESEYWFYFKQGNAIFNGSLTHEKRRTSQRLKDIVEQIQYAFTKKGFETLCRLHHMRPNQPNRPGPRGGGNGSGGGNRNHDRRHGQRHDQGHRDQSHDQHHVAPKQEQPVAVSLPELGNVFDAASGRVESKAA